MTRFLVLDGDEAHAREIGHVLGSLDAAVDLVSAPSLQAVAEQAGGGDDVDLVVASYDTLGADGTAALLRKFAKLRAGGRVLLLTSSADRASLASLFGEYGLSNLLARNGDVAHDVSWSEGDELLVTIRKILRGDVFGLDKYFAGTCTRTELAVTTSGERERVLDDARTFAKSAGAQGRFAELLCSACDELVTNALYNAPVDAAGKPRHAHLSRTTAVSLAGGEEVAVTLVCDGKRMGISVSDCFGSLQASTITQYLAKCLRRGGDQVDEKEGGAGLGLFYVFEAVSHFVVNIAPGQRTEMIGMLDVKGRYKDFVTRPKSFNIFVAGGS